jgi:hypothetical protein
MVKVHSGGGITSNKYVTSKSGQKVEPRSTAIDPAGVSQRDVSTAFKKTPVEVGPGYSTKPMPSTGIANAVRGRGGPGPGGGSRMIYPSGAQGQYGPVNPGQVNQAPDVPATKPGRDILSDYGPELKRGR